VAGWLERSEQGCASSADAVMRNGVPSSLISAQDAAGQEALAMMPPPARFTIEAEFPFDSQAACGAGVCQEGRAAGLQLALQVLGCARSSFRGGSRTASQGE